MKLLFLNFLFWAFTFLKAQNYLPWYHTTSIYQIYPRSYYDSNGDGIGDIQGIIQKLDYIKSMGFETLWISPFFSSPQKDFGYDVKDYQSIAFEYGTMQEVEKLIQEVHKRGMKIILDMVLNHTSIEHEWFLHDVQRNLEERGLNHDFYIWRDKPNNWKSMVKGSAWHYHPVRKQYYYAAFLPFQPDLNYYNPKVKNAMLENVRFWLNKGVDGFRLDIFNSIYEDSLFRNNSFSFQVENNFQNKNYTANLPPCLDFAEELRKVCDEYGEKMLIGEIIGNRAISRKYCGDDKNNRLTLAFNFEMLRFKFNAKYFEKLIKNQENDFSLPFMPVYVFSNHDRRRMITRVKGDLRKAKIIHTIQFMARGVPCIYYGEEIGMIDGNFYYKKSLDPIPHVLKLPKWLVNLSGETINRDEVRTPMQWDTTFNAGFSTNNQTWLPVNTDFKEKNVMNAIQDSSSFYHYFKFLHNQRSFQPTEIQRKRNLLIINNKVIINFHKKSVKWKGKKFKPISVNWI